MIERTGGLQIKGSSIRDGGSCFLASSSPSSRFRSRLLRFGVGTHPVSSPDPESPLTPGADRITTEAVNESAGD